MKILNPLQSNNWPIRKLLIIIITLQLLLWGAIGLDFIGFRIPILRQLVCFVYLTFIPGILILRILKLRILKPIENLLYSVGVSLSFLMLIGLLMNTFFPFIGINNPISIVPLLITVNFILLLLAGLCYQTDDNFSNSTFVSFNELFSAPSLFLCLIPIWTIIGTYFMNFYNNNSLLLIVIFLISSIIVLVFFDYIPGNLYPLAIFITSLSLLFHNSLISMYLVGWDIQVEYYLANKVITNSLWDPTLFSNVNSMLSIVMLAPIYSILSNMSLTWVFKIIYPSIFSLLPVGLYLIFKKQTSEKIAFMSTFFFISFYVFYAEMLQLARQEIAEYFFMLIILLLIQNRHDTSDRILLTLFSFSVIFSHYGLSYIVLGSIICSLVLLFLYQKYVDKSSLINTINFIFTLLFAVFLAAWYIYVSSSSAIYTIVYITENIVENFISDFLNPDKAQGLAVITTNAVTFFRKLNKIMFVFTQLFISIGLYYTINNTIKRKSIKYLKFNYEYLSLCVVFYMILIASIAVPNFSSALNTTRLYQITLILLAPFCVIGGIILLRTFLKIVFHLNVKEYNSIAIKTMSIFFTVFLLFNIGWIYEIVGDRPTSFSLNNTLDFPKFNDREVAGKEWLYQENRIGEDNGYVYADIYRYSLFLSCFDMNKVSVIPEIVDGISRNSYIYLSTYNLFKNEVLIFHQTGEEYVDSNIYISSKNQIYNNGGAKVYYQ